MALETAEHQFSFALLMRKQKKVIQKYNFILIQFEVNLSQDFQSPV
jgi:hypothetical protein